MMIDGTATATRVRAYHVTDGDITQLARTFTAPRPRRRTDTDATGQNNTGDQR
jgi:S-DNA-T family DNA segregation ATPase FtsK/SpoIIIE